MEARRNHLESRRAGGIGEARVIRDERVELRRDCESRGEMDRIERPQPGRGQGAGKLGGVGTELDELQARQDDAHLCRIARLGNSPDGSGNLHLDDAAGQPTRLVGQDAQSASVSASGIALPGR